MVQWDRMGYNLGGIMAIKKNIEVGNTGLMCDYIKVQGFLYESENGKLQVQLGVYSSAEASQAGKDPISRINLDLELSGLSMNGDIRSQIYVALKQTESFTGAIDV